MHRKFGLTRTIAISENEIETAQSETPVHEISSKRGLVWRKGRKRAKKNTRKVAQAEKPVHEFGRKVLSLQNENFKCNMVMPAPGAGRAL